jgi:antitoxin component of MazEF toxin-antitoxin module
MEKKFTKHGNSIALVIDKPLLKMLKIDENATVVLSIKNGSLVITPKHSISAEHTYKQIDKIADDIMGQYEDVFRRLSNLGKSIEFLKKRDESK